MEGNEECRNENRSALPHLGSVRCSCSSLHPRTWALTVEWNGGRSVPCPTESRGSPGAAGSARGAGRGGGTTRRGAPQAPHLHPPLSKDRLPRGAPTLNASEPSLRESWPETFPALSPVPQRVVWLRAGAAGPRGNWRLLPLPSPLRANSHLPLRRHSRRGEVGPALRRLQAGRTWGRIPGGRAGGSFGTALAP